MSSSPVELALAFSTGLVAFALLLSGATKIGRSANTLAAMIALRVPVGLRRRPVAVLVPTAEILIALVLLLGTGPARSFAGVVAAAMLAVFTALLVGALRRGEEAECGCFGPLSASDRVTPWSVARNLVLIVAALLVGTAAWGSDLFIVQLFEAPLTTLLALVLCWALLAVAVLLRELVVARRRSPSTASPASASAGAGRGPAPLSPLSIALGLDPARPGEVMAGDPVPAGELVTDHGIALPLANLANDKPVLLVFLSLGCSSCTPVAEAAPGWRTRLHPLEVVVATSSRPDALAEQYPDLPPFTRYGSYAALQSFGVQRSPAAVALGGLQQPVVASPIAYGLQEIEALVDALESARK